MENREEKMQLLMGLTIGKDDNVQVFPLQQVRKMTGFSVLVQFNPQYSNVYLLNMKIYIFSFVCVNAMQEVLIVWGEYDQIFPLEKALELKK